MLNMIDMDNMITSNDDKLVSLYLSLPLLPVTSKIITLQANVIYTKQRCNTSADHGSLNSTVALSAASHHRR